MPDEKQDGKSEIYDSHRFKYGMGIFVSVILLLSCMTYLAFGVVTARRFAGGRDTMCDATMSKALKCGGKYGYLVVHYKAQKNESISSEKIAKFAHNSTIALRLERCRRPACRPQIPCRISTTGDVKHGWKYPKRWLIFGSVAAAFFAALAIFLSYRCHMYAPFTLPGGFVDADKSRPTS